MPELAEWDSFYVITGSAAGTLIGLQFVVMTLVAGRPLFRAADAGPAWATPQIVHFSVALLLSALMRAAWHAITPVMALCGLIGFGGVVYMAIVGIRLRKQRTYGPDREDWVFHFLLPLLAYLVLALSAAATFLRVDRALFGIAAPTLLLVFIGIHNTWDSISFMAYARIPDPNGKPEQDNESDNETPRSKSRGF